MGAIKLEDLPHYTYDDYKKREGSWELINGIAYNISPAPVTKHQRISQKIGWLLETALKDCQKRQALLPVDWKIDEDTIVQPDNLVVCDEDMKGAYITKAPLIIFEILSKSTAAKDTGLKFELYEREGDFDKKSYRFEPDECALDFDFSKIWA